MTTTQYELSEEFTNGNNCRIVLRLTKNDKGNKKKEKYRLKCKMCIFGYMTVDNCSYCKDTQAALHIDLETESKNLGSLVTFKIKIVSYDVWNDEDTELIKIHVYIRFINKNKEKPHVVSVSSKFLGLNRFYKVNPNDDDENSWLALYSSKSWVDPEEFEFDLELALVTVSETEVNQHVNQLTAGMLVMSLYDDEETTDVELVGFGGTVRAHSNVLAAVSPVMRSAFYDCDLREKRDRRLSVPDASVRTLQIIKQFMYKGFVEASPAELASVLPVASRFMLDSLARACAAALTELPPDDLIPLLKLDYTDTKPAEDAKAKKPPCNGTVEAVGLLEDDKHSQGKPEGSDSE